MVVRRWGFWHDDKLAMVATVSRVRPGKVWVRFSEAASYALSTPLPQRLNFESRVKARVQGDIEELMGAGWEMIARFDGNVGDDPKVFSHLPHHHPQQG